MMDTVKRYVGSQTLWMIVVDYNKQERLVAPSVDVARPSDPGVPGSLGLRKGYRFTKQGFALEGVQARYLPRYKAWLRWPA